MTDNCAPAGAQEREMSEKRPAAVGVHATHCCPIHGCRYGDTDCPVALLTVPPVYPSNNGCEICEDDDEGDDDLCWMPGTARKLLGPRSSPHPQPDRAALVERLARVVEAHPSFVDGRAEAEDLARCIVSRLSAPAGAQEREPDAWLIEWRSLDGEWFASDAKTTPPPPAWEDSEQYRAVPLYRVPQPQGDRAALVERLRLRANTHMIHVQGVCGHDDVVCGDECRACIRDLAQQQYAEELLLSAPAEATEPPGHTDLMVSPESVPTYSPRSHFGASLREARVAAGLRLRDAAALFGVAPERYGKVERGVAEATEPKTDPFPAPGVYTQEQGEQNRK